MTLGSSLRRRGEPASNWTGGPANEETSLPLGMCATLFKRMNHRDELIRIDHHGVAHPIGTVASQRMRPHQGTYRLLPSPAHVVLMRYTGEDGRVDKGDGAIVRIAGEITAPGVICDILAMVGQTGWRGILSVHQGATTREIYVDGGTVLGVKSTDTEERLGRVMYRYGHVSQEALAELEDAVVDGRRFGEIAVELGVVTKGQVYKAFAQQITEVVVAALHVSDGTYFFLDGFEDTTLPTRQAVSVNTLLMDGVTRMDELAYFTQKIPTVEHVPARTNKSEPPAEDLLRLFELVDGVRSVRELGRVTGLQADSVAACLHQAATSQRGAGCRSRGSQRCASCGVSSRAGSWQGAGASRQPHYLCGGARGVLRHVATGCGSGRQRPSGCRTRG